MCSNAEAEHYLTPLASPRDSSSAMHRHQSPDTNNQQDSTELTAVSNQALGSEFPGTSSKQHDVNDQVPTERSSSGVLKERGQLHRGDDIGGTNNPNDETRETQTSLGDSEFKNEEDSDVSDNSDNSDDSEDSDNDDDKAASVTSSKKLERPVGIKNENNIQSATKAEEKAKAAVEDSPNNLKNIDVNDENVQEQGSFTLNDREKIYQIELEKVFYKSVQFGKDPFIEEKKEIAEDRLKVQIDIKEWTAEMMMGKTLNQLKKDYPQVVEDIHELIEARNAVDLLKEQIEIEERIAEFRKGDMLNRLREGQLQLEKGERKLVIEEIAANALKVRIEIEERNAGLETGKTPNQLRKNNLQVAEDQHELTEEEIAAHRMQVQTELKELKAELQNAKMFNEFVMQYLQREKNELRLRQEKIAAARLNLQLERRELTAKFKIAKTLNQSRKDYPQVAMGIHKIIGKKLLVRQLVHLEAACEEYGDLIGGEEGSSLEVKEIDSLAKVLAEMKKNWAKLLKKKAERNNANVPRIQPNDELKCT